MGYSECDHTVLQVHDDGELVRISDLGTSLRGFKRYNRNFVVVQEYSQIEVLDRRRGFTRQFNYCPDCGAKLDWKKIKDGLKDDA